MPRGGRRTLTVLPEPRVCEREGCGKAFTPGRRVGAARFCSPYCYYKAYREQPEHREKYRAAQKENYYRHHPKSVARYQVKLALLDGRLRKPATCSECGDAAEYIEAHHHNGYDQDHWLDVLWLCKRCHGKKHRKPAPPSCAFRCTRKATKRLGGFDVCASCDEMVTRIIESMPARIVA